MFLILANAWYSQLKKTRPSKVIDWSSSFTYIVSPMYVYFFCINPTEAYRQYLFLFFVFFFSITPMTCTLKEIQDNFSHLGGWVAVSHCDFNFHFTLLPVIWIPYPVKCLFKSFAYFSLELSAFLYWPVGTLHIFEWVLCQICSTIIFSHSMACLLMVTFHGMEVLSFNVVQFINIFFND